MATHLYLREAGSIPYGAADVSWAPASEGKLWVWGDWFADNYAGPTQTLTVTIQPDGTWHVDLDVDDRDPEG
jgi:hypothetical protein